MPGVQALDASMTANGIAHAYATYDGDHLNRITLRFEEQVLPFFARNLVFDAGRAGGERHD